MLGAGNLSDRSPFEVFAKGLDNPRGLKFGPDGWLYVAEAGRGGTSLATKPEEYEQVPEPIGPYTAGPASARVRGISPDGRRQVVVADGLPSSQTSAKSGGMVSGIADVAFVGRTLYLLVAGAGGSHGLAGTTNAVMRVEGDGTLAQVVDLSAFWRAHPPAVGDPGDAEPDGTPFAMIQARGRLYVVEAHSGAIDEVAADGRITRLIDLSRSLGHVVPTGIAFRDGAFFVGNLHGFPVRVGAARIHEVADNGEINALPAKLTAVLSVAVDARGRLYALESTTSEGSPPVPGTGRLVRLAPRSAEVEAIATGLTFPTSMAFGPDGALYVSNFGFGFPPGAGQIVRIAMPPGG